MKKLFIAAMALATIVSCSKDGTDTELTSKMKSVSITIENAQNVTRGVTAPTGNSNFACATNKTLSVVFTDRNENLVKSYALTEGKGSGLVYTFHALPESVTGFFVIGTGGGKIANLPTSIDAAVEMWKDESAVVNKENTAVVVYGACTDLGTPTDCTDPDSGEKYKLYKGSVTVAPYLARVEISAITCNDLGAANIDNDPLTLGYETLTLRELAIADDMKETFNNVTMTANITGTPAAAQPVSTNAGEGKVWSWNVTPGKASDYLVSLTLDVASDYYKVNSPTRTIKATSYNGVSGAGVTANQAVAEFQSGHIYKMTVPFSEQDLHDNSTSICVEVTVTIQDWVVNFITPVFGNN